MAPTWTPSHHENHVMPTQSLAHTTWTLLCPDSSPFAMVILHVSCISPTYNSQLKYNSSCMLLCSNSNPAPTYYAIPLHVITLASLLLWFHISILANITVVCSSIKSCLYICISHVQILICVTIVYSLHQLQPPNSSFATLWSFPLGSSHLGLNSEHWFPLYHGTSQTSDFKPQPVQNRVFTVDESGTFSRWFWKWFQICKIKFWNAKSTFLLHPITPICYE